MAPARTAAWLSRAYKRHGEAVFAYAFHLTGARDEAERLSVAAFMDAHDVVAGGASIRRVRVWLLDRVHKRAPILPHDRRGGTVRHLPPAGGRELTSMRAELAPRPSGGGRARPEPVVRPSAQRDRGCPRRPDG